MACMSPIVSVFVAPVPVRTPLTLRPPASAQTKLSPRLRNCSRIWSEPPSPIATVQITAPMPMVMPSIVRPVRNLFRPKVRSATRRSELESIRLCLILGTGYEQAGFQSLNPWPQKARPGPSKVYGPLG